MTGVVGAGVTDAGAAAPTVFRQGRFQRPPGATELIIVRHGESAPAVTGEMFPLVDGQGDPSLAPEGHAQAERVAERLAGEAIDAAYATSLQRTVQTAEPLLRRTGISLSIEPDLREVHLGEWEGGLFRRMVAEGHPSAVRMREEQRWDAIPGGEGAEPFARRVRKAVLRVAAAHPDQRVVVFTHGGVIGRILAEATGARPFSFNGADNGSISHVVVAADRWTVRRFNDTAHLESGFTVRSAQLT